MTDAVFTARLARAQAAYRAALTTGRKRKARQARRRINAAIAGLSLGGYLDFLNRDAGEAFALAGAAYWRERGVTSALQLALILDAEHARNVEKSERYGDFDDDEPADYDDGQPDEAQEWHDFDPDC